MKKLMIAAAIAAIGIGAFANDCGPGEQKKTYGTSWAYKWKFTGKTTDGRPVGKTVANSNWCGPSEESSDCNYYRVKASLKIQGYTFICGPGCGSDGFETFPEEYEVFWQTKPHKAYLFGGVSTELSHIIGKSKKQYEAFGTATFLACETSDPTHATYNLAYAGLGKYSKKYSRVTSVSGNFAGTVSSSWAWNLKKDWCKPAGYWDCETLQLTGCGEPTVAFGKWSAKFNKSAAKKFLNNQAYRGKLPSWVTPFTKYNNDHSAVHAN